MRLRDKVSIITGAARGIGAAIAELFAAEGARVVIVDVLEHEGEATARHIREFGGQALFRGADVSNEQQVQEMVKVVVETFGHVDILCNNAGILHPEDSSVLELSWEVWRRVLDINLGGAFLCSKHALPSMIEQGQGAIIMTASISALLGNTLPYSQDAYTAAKGGLISLTKSLAAQFGKPHRIRCNAILPGPIVTPLNEHLFATEEGRALRLGILALPYLGAKEDIAQAALYLADEHASRFVTGSLLVVDGGATSLLY